jgi:hypothetical protein
MAAQLLFWVFLVLFVVSGWAPEKYRPAASTVFLSLALAIVGLKVFGWPL